VAPGLEVCPSAINDGEMWSDVNPKDGELQCRNKINGLSNAGQPEDPLFLGRDRSPHPTGAVRFQARWGMPIIDMQDKEKKANGSWIMIMLFRSR
jgi:hypothetical protein